MKNNSIKNVVAVGIGAALFVVIGMIPIPSLAPNTQISIQYAVQALLAVIFGPVVGFLIGLIGHALKDAMSGGLWWSWILASAFFGGIVGLVRSRIQIEKGNFGSRQILTFNLVQIVANLLVWGVLAPIGDIIIYKEAVNKVFTQGIVAALSNSVTVAIAGTLLLIAYARTQTQEGSLSKD